MTNGKVNCLEFLPPQATDAQMIVPMVDLLTGEYDDDLYGLLIDSEVPTPQHMIIGLTLAQSDYICYGKFRLNPTKTYSIDFDTPAEAIIAWTQLKVEMGQLALILPPPIHPERN